MTSGLWFCYERLPNIIFLNNICIIKSKQLIILNSRMFFFTEGGEKLGTLNTFVQCLGKQKMPIGYGNSEAEDKLKLANYECTRSPSQLKTEQTQEGFFTCLSPLIYKKQSLSPIYL